MKTIGLVGGMSPESTKDYYGILIDLAKERLEGNLNNPEIVIYSVNLSVMMGHMKAGRPENVVGMLAEVLDRLGRAGAEVGALTANTPHVFIDELTRRSPFPLVNILDTTFRKAKEAGCRKALLLGTYVTMASDMYPRKFSEGSMDIVVPDTEDQAFIHHSIEFELTRGIVSQETRSRYLEICRNHVEKVGVDAMILGCTEIPMVFEEGDLPVTLVNTTRIHAEAIFDAAMGG